MMLQTDGENIEMSIVLHPAIGDVSKTILMTVLPKHEDR